MSNIVNERFQGSNYSRCQQVSTSQSRQVDAIAVAEKDLPLIGCGRLQLAEITKEYFGCKGGVFQRLEKFSCSQLREMVEMPVVSLRGSWQNYNFLNAWVISKYILHHLQSIDTNVSSN